MPDSPACVYPPVPGSDPAPGTGGGSLAVDSADPLRHTFTVLGTDVDVELPASRSVRTVVDLPAGTYDYICDITGHESMTGTLSGHGGLAP